MASNEISLIYQVSRLNRLLTESQVGYCNTTGFLGVIGEISLSIHIGVVSDDLDRVLVSTNCTIGTQSPELAADCSLRCCIDLLCHWQGCKCYVVYDSDSEAILNFFSLQVVEYCLNIRRRSILGTETITTSNNKRSIFLAIEQ